MDRRATRELELQREWEGRHRFQELDSEDSEGDAFPVRRRRVTGDKLHFTGYDLGSGRQGSDDGEWNDYREYDGHDGHDGHDRHDTSTGDWQMASREKEEELLEGALRRIRRAKLRGDLSVDFTRAELDALERDRMRHQEPATRISPRVRPAATLSQPKKRSGGLLGLGVGASKPRKPSKRPSLPIQDEEEHPRSASATSTERTSSGSRGAAARAPTRSSSSPIKGASGSGSKSPMRAASNGNRQPFAAAPYDLERDPPRYFATAIDAYRSSPLRNDGPRPLPDDLEWVPRIRSASSTSQSPYPTSIPPNDQRVYAPAHSPRRNFSGPPAVNYSTSRRVPPNHLLNASSRATPLVPAGTPMTRSGSGLAQEVIEISSDDSDAEILERDEDSDDGVRVDLRPGEEAGYAARARRAGAWR